MHQASPPPGVLPVDHDGQPIEVALARRVATRWGLLTDLPALPPLTRLVELLAPLAGDARLLHLDIRACNLVSSGESISGLFDWGCAMVGHPSLELARVAENAPLPENELDMDALLAGYREVAPAGRRSGGGRPAPAGRCDHAQRRLRRTPRSRAAGLVRRAGTDPRGGAGMTLTGRLSATPSALLDEEVLGPQFRYELEHLLGEYVAIEKALVVEYVRMGVLTDDEARSLGAALDQVTAESITADKTENMSDIAFAVERFVEQRLPGRCRAGMSTAAATTCSPARS
ncbi:phosphotransferase [Micromonospora sp. M12]